MVGDPVEPGGPAARLFTGAQWALHVVNLNETIRVDVPVSLVKVAESISGPVVVEVEREAPLWEK